MTEASRDRVKTYGYVAFLLLAGIAINILAMVNKAPAQTIDLHGAHPYQPTITQESLGVYKPRQRTERGNSVSLSGVTPVLAAKAREIQSACGSRIISSVRHTYVRGGGGALSLHASGRAVDIAGNPACIYAHLQGWSGGYSIDYHRIRPNHVHISYGGREDGKRFNHYGGRRYAKRGR